METITWLSFLLLVVARRDCSCHNSDALSEEVKSLKQNHDGLKQRLDEQNDAIFDIMLKLQSSCKDTCVELIAEMNDTVVGLTQRVNEQVEEISNIKSKQMAYEGDYIEMNESVVSLQQQLAVQKVESQQSVSFSARVLPSYPDIAPYTVIKFSQVVTNIGNAYNSSTGEFTVPWPGVYVFYSNILSGENQLVETILQVNGNTKLWLYSGGNPFRGAGSNMIIIHLESGDKVRMLTDCCSTRPTYIHQVRSTFSGFLLTSD